MNTDRLLAAFVNISQKPEWRFRFIQQMVAFEKQIQSPGLDVREDVTGPLVDALFDDNQIVTKELSDGTVLEFFYRSKIARDFLMSEPDRPDHVWEPQTTRLLVKLARNAKHVVIGGAYFGDQAILVAKEIAKTGGIVHAFEPNNDQRKMLMRNAELNSLSNIHCFGEGLWDNSSSTFGLEGYDAFAHTEAVDSDRRDVFRTVTVDEYLKAEGVVSLDLLMLDIEGAELRALMGAVSFLAQPVGRAPNVVFEVHRSYVDWACGLENTEIVRYLIDLGYCVFAVRDFHSNYDLSHKPIEIIPANAVYLEGPPHGFNMVAVKDISLLTGPDFRLCERVSPKLLRHKVAELHHPIGGL
jgi:FkbM family methyltransferase